MKKSTASTSTDSEKRIAFGYFFLTQKEIDRIYEKRRKSLFTGHCIRCGRELLRKAKLKCDNCDTDLQEFCFESQLKDRDKKIQEAIKNIPYKTYHPFECNKKRTG